MFSHSSLTYSARLSRPSVLALYSDQFIGEVRLKPLLNALLARGIIGDYRIADRQMELLGPVKEHRFSHIWCQRNVSTAQFRFLRQHRHAPIIYDLDDLLTSAPEFVINTRARTLHRIEWCLQNAAVVTVTSAKLATLLREDCPTLASEPVIVPNGYAAAAIPDWRTPQRRLVWASGDRPYMLKDDPAFIEKLARLANRARYRVVFFGRFDAEHLKLFDDPQHLPHLEFASYREFLRSCAGSIGLAPLPTRLPEQAQRYFDGKSDIKLVDFLASGLLPVCSNAVPYATSELFVPELAGDNPDSLLDRIENAIAAPDATRDLVDAAIYRSGLIEQREFSRLSLALDRCFA